MGWRSVNLHTHISLVNRYVYVEVPKAGCGTMKATLGGMEAARMGPGLAGRVQEFPHDRMRATPFVKPFQLPADFLEVVLTSPDYRRFTVVRNPASRVLSAYLEKIRQGLKQSTTIVAAIKANTGVDVAAQDVSFDQFLDVVAGQPSREQDPHWPGDRAVRRRHPPGGAGQFLGPRGRAHRHARPAGAVLLPQLHRCEQQDRRLLHTRADGPGVGHLRP
jgi:hypothetical protein